MWPTTPPLFMTTQRRSAICRSSIATSACSMKPRPDGPEKSRACNPDDIIFDFRTMAERINARLKDEFGARFVRVRGAIKVKCHLVFGLVALTVDQILRVTKFRPALT